MKTTLSALFFLLTVIVLSMNDAQSQVTIGGLTEPQAGAILDLNSTVKGGLLLPHVDLPDLTQIPAVGFAGITEAQDTNDALAGTIVYNTNTITGVGLCIWDGNNWIRINTSSLASVKAENGVSTSDGETVKLGGDLTEATIINLENSNLIFDRSSGNIGIGTSEPKAPLHVDAADDDPVILKNVKLTSDEKNEIDEPDALYYDLKISEGGVIRKVEPKQPNELYIYILNDSITVADGTNNGSTGSDLKWKKGDSGSAMDYIELPEDGAYIFSFRLCGDLNPGTPSLSRAARSFYLSAFKNDNTNVNNLLDIAELVIIDTARGTNTLPYLRASYSINFTISGKANDKIYFRLGAVHSPGNFTWTLQTAPKNQANKTSVIFWRL
jgi:hypothetical protein